jgi:amino acid transporter/nucleotide-binding universal stress UspA family protein
MSWFAQAIAGSLYAIAFGRFAAELLLLFDVPTFGLSIETLTSILMTAIILLFTAINYWGASETATVGNILTITKIIILALVVLFGVLTMSRTTDWTVRFTDGFFSEGLLNVFIAMGFTFIAFEGYEIIAQSGEEVIDPRRNIPRAIFFSIGIVVVIYVLVGFVAIGATSPPSGLEAHEYLGLKGEVAIIEVAQQVFPWGIGGLVLLLSGLASTTSALNATTYASSRVSFAMGRERNLPSFFARIHPSRHTPYLAVVGTGGLMIIMAWTLPIEDVASAASIMFLLLFLLVNLAVLFLRLQRPDLDRGFKVPWFPILPVLAILLNSFLALSLLQLSAIAWITAVAWILVGLVAYFLYFSKLEEMEKPKEILHEEVLTSRDYSVLVPVANQEQARILGNIGSILAKDRSGEVLALHVVQVPPQLTLGEGRLFLKEGREHLLEVIEQSKANEVPVHTIIRLGRSVANAIRLTALENASDLVVLGWPGYTNTAGKLFGSVIDPIVDNPPTDVVVTRYRKWRPLKRILVPFLNGSNSRLAVRLALSMAQQGHNGDIEVTLLHVLPSLAGERDQVRGQRAVQDSLNGVTYSNISIDLAVGDDPVEVILEKSANYDLIVIGATDEPLFRNFLVGTLPERIARSAGVTVMMVKRRSGPLHSFVRQAILEPTTPKPLEEEPEELEPVG